MFVVLILDGPFLQRIADTAKLVTNMALVYATIGEHETAVEQLTKAIDLDRDLTVA